MVAYALVAWTVLVWTTRIRNILEDDAGTTALLVPIGLTILAVAVLVDRRAVTLLAAATIAVWAVRLPLILSHDHSAAFYAVHAVLAVVSFALAGLALRSRSRGPRRSRSSAPA